MRKVVFAGLALPVVTAACFTSVAARAQDSTATQQPLILQREQLGVYALVDAARARARQGDCAGALDAFDQAIRTLTDPTLRRDRGLCHEKLNDPYPAIDDFRAYLTARPDASDADDIGARLDRLETSVGLGTSSGRAAEDPLRPQITGQAAGQATGQATTEMTVDANGNTTSKYDSVKLEQSDESGPLRRGKGFVLGLPFLGIRKFFGDGASNASVAESIGARLSYSFGAPNSIVFELGYTKFNVANAGALGLGGVTTQVAYEARLPFNPKKNIDNLAILGIGLGYDQLFTSAAADGSGAGDSIAGIGPRIRGGYRHNFGGSSAIEVTGDGGLMKYIFITGDGAGNMNPWLGLNVALLFGM